MFVVSALLLFAPAQSLPVAPQPRPVRGWVLRHTFAHKAPVDDKTARLWIYQP